MKGIVLAIAAVALMAGCASDNRGGMGEGTYQDTGSYERPSEYLQGSQSRQPGSTEGINNMPVKPTAPGGIGPTEPR